MDEIQSCLADAHYSDAIRGGVGDNHVRPLALIPELPENFDRAEFITKHKLGFDTAVMPKPRKKLGAPSGLSIAQPSTLAELIEIMGGVT